MIFESQQEYFELIDEVSKSLRTLKTKKKLDNTEFDKALPSSDEEDEEDNSQERKRSFEDNLLFISKTMPDRGHDKDRGTHGWLMGEPNPGRSL